MREPVYFPLFGNGVMLHAYWKKIAGRDILMAACSFPGFGVRFIPYSDLNKPRQKELGV